MIKIEGVTKTYKPRKGLTCTAIDDVSITLPDKGMVFVVGKSGSGKSTLLNMIGGLDGVTSGKITADGNVVTELNRKELAAYRNSYVGFIFQDYHVLDNLTVRENVTLSLEIADGKYEDTVDEILKKLEIYEYKDRYPVELSGGQKQRLSIARALVKDARVILCDEPCGNLDKKTSEQVRKILKEISAHKLVVIVSHSLVDAERFGDRIIELADGRIVRDRQRRADYNNEFRIEDGVAYLPCNRDLADDELESLNQAAKSNPGLRLEQIKNEFFPTAEIDATESTVPLWGSGLSRKTSNKLYKMVFSKNRKVVINVLLTAILLICFCIFQSFLAFDANEALSDSLTGDGIHSVPLQKCDGESHELYTGGLKRVSDEDIAAFYDSGYKGKIYSKYNSTVPVIGMPKIDFEQGIVIEEAFAMLYLQETFGVINCDSQFVASVYGNGGKLEFLALSDEIKDYGIYITDYIADSYLFFNESGTYDDLLGCYSLNSLNFAYVNGIIHTGYKQKYGELIDTFTGGLENPEDTGRQFGEMKKSRVFIQFATEVLAYLGYGYSLDVDYAEAIKHGEFRNWLRISGVEFCVDGQRHAFDGGETIFSPSSLSDYTLSEGQIVLSARKYNSLFGTAYSGSEDFVPHGVTLKFYENGDQAGRVIFEKEFEIVDVIPGMSNYVNMDYAGDLREHDVIPYGLILENHDMIGAMMAVANKHNFLVNSAETAQLDIVNKLMAAFSEFFLFLAVLILIVAVAFLVNIGVTNIKKSKYEIGIMKALGIDNFSIMKIFLRFSLMLTVAIILVSNVGIFFCTNIANTLLLDATEHLLGVRILNLKIIRYMPRVVMEDLLIICAVSVVSFIVPQVSLLKIRSMEIIRAKE